MNSVNKDTNNNNRFKDSTIQAQSNNMTKAACRNQIEKSVLILMLKPEAQFRKKPSKKNRRLKPRRNTHPDCDNSAVQKILRHAGSGLSRVPFKGKPEQVRRADQALSPIQSGSFVGHGP